jgi:carbonic anhydrase
MAHSCEAIVVMCMDFRFQSSFDKWLQKNLGHGNYDRVGFAGGVKSWEIIFSQIEISRRLHQIKKVVLINHEDCGAYGAEGSPERHAKDLKEARKKVNKAFPDLQVMLYYSKLNGDMETVK